MRRVKWPGAARRTVLLGLMCGVGVLPSTAKMCGVTIGASNEFGESRPYKVVTFRDSDGKDYKSLFNGLTVRNIPCAKYSFVLTRSDFVNSLGDIEGQIVLISSHQWLTANPDRNLIIGPAGAMTGDSRIPEDYAIRGRIRPVPAETESLCIKVYQLYGPQVFEAAIESDGSFSFGRDIVGRVIAVVLRGEQVLGTQILSVSGQSRNLPDIAIVNAK
jgi:hypothetical protein